MGREALTLPTPRRVYNSCVSRQTCMGKEELRRYPAMLNKFKIRLNRASPSMRFISMHDRYVLRGYNRPVKCTSTVLFRSHMGYVASRRTSPPVVQSHRRSSYPVSRPDARANPLGRESGNRKSQRIAMPAISHYITSEPVPSIE